MILSKKGTDTNGTKLRLSSMILNLMKSTKNIGFMRFPSMQKRLNLAAFGTDTLK